MYPAQALLQMKLINGNQNIPRYKKAVFFKAAFFISLLQMTSLENFCLNIKQILVSIVFL